MWAQSLLNPNFLPSYLANAGGSGRETTNRQSEESTAPSASASLPGQFKQRPPMYNASTASPTAPTSPTTPTSTPSNNAPPPAATAAQPDMPTPAAQPAPTPAAPQTQPKKNLSLTVKTSLIHGCDNDILLDCSALNVTRQRFYSEISLIDVLRKL